MAEQGRWAERGGKKTPERSDCKGRVGAVRRVDVL
jgi:hypothetical protein